MFQYGLCEIPTTALICKLPSVSILRSYLPWPVSFYAFYLKKEYNFTRPFLIKYFRSSSSLENKCKIFIISNYRTTEDSLSCSQGFVSQTPRPETYEIQHPYKNRAFYMLAISSTCDSVNIAMSVIFTKTQTEFHDQLIALRSEEKGFLRQSACIR